MTDDSLGAVGNPPGRAMDKAIELYHRKRPRLALQIVDRILNRSASHAAAHHLRGVLLMQLDQLDAAEAAFEKAIELAPSNVPFRNTYGVWLKRVERFSEALAQFEWVAAADPAFAPVHTNVGLVHQRLENFEAAEQSHRRALALDPQYRPALHNLANTLEALGRDAEAVEFFDRALQVGGPDDEIRMDRGLCLLRLGDYARGWADYESRLDVIKQRLRHRVIPAPFWDGTPFEGKTLAVYQEQGNGDVIQCARYLPMVKASGGRVLAVVSEALDRLIATTDSVDEIVNRFEDVPPVDLKVPVFSLPRLFETRWPDIPVDVPYVRASPEVKVDLADDGLRVGLVWAGSDTFSGNHFRSMSVDRFRPLLDVPGVTFYSLQFGLDRAALTAPKLDESIRHLNDDALGDFHQTGRLMEDLDLVITVDTVTAHLAGALNRPAWVLLSATPDWRWGRGHDTSPWYPSLRLFRQERPGDWDGVIERVRRALVGAASGKT